MAPPYRSDRQTLLRSVPRLPKRWLAWPLVGGGRAGVLKTGRDRGRKLRGSEEERSGRAGRRRAEKIYWPADGGERRRRRRDVM